MQTFTPVWCALQRIKQLKCNFLQSETKFPSDLTTSKYHKATELNTSIYMICLLTSSKDFFFFFIFLNQRKISLQQDANSVEKIQRYNTLWFLVLGFVGLVGCFFLLRKNTELSLYISRTAARWKLPLCPLPVKPSFWFHAFMITPSSQIISIDQSSISCQKVTACNFKVFKFGKFWPNTTHIEVMHYSLNQDMRVLIVR